MNKQDNNNKYLRHNFRNKPKYCQPQNKKILHIIISRVVYATRQL